MVETDVVELAAVGSPSLEDLQHWTWVMGRAQQMMMEHLAAADGRGGGEGGGATAPKAAQAALRLAGDEPVRRSGEADGGAGARCGPRGSTSGSGRWAARRRGESSALAEKADKDKRFAAPEWRDNPLFDTIRQTYLLVSDRLLGSVDAIEGVDEATREQDRAS